MWGVIPLDLRNVPGNVPRNKMYPVTSPISITASKSTSPSSPEIKRLTHERMFLQERYETVLNRKEHYTTQHNTTQHYTALHYITLHYTTLYCAPSSNLPVLNVLSIVCEKSSYFLFYHFIAGNHLLPPLPFPPLSSFTSPPLPLLLIFPFFSFFSFDSHHISRVKSHEMHLSILF